MVSTGALLSMTGFGRAQGEHGSVSIEIEIKSVNHRYADISCKMPRQYSAFEVPLRSLASKHISRGKVEISISRKKIIDDQMGSDAVSLNRALYESYLKIYRDRLAELGSGVNPQAFEKYIGEILAKPGVVENASDAVSDEEQEYELTARVLTQALESLITMRQREGEEIRKDLTTRLDTLSKITQLIGELSAQTPDTLKERLVLRLNKLASDVHFDENRIVQEAAILADRADVTEELVRLEAHLGAFRSALLEAQTGKRLDFLVQEIGRECNTIGSKAQRSEISHAVVSAKVELEKIREQLQNVE